MVNVSLNAAGSYMTVVSNAAPHILRGTRNSHAAPSVVTCARSNRALINRPTGHRTIAGPRGALFTVGHLVNHHFRSRRMRHSISVVPFGVVTTSGNST